MLLLGRGGGQAVSVLAFYYDDLSSNPAGIHNLSVKLVFEKNENKQKEDEVGPFFYKTMLLWKKHSDGMLQVTCLILTNLSALLQNNIFFLMGPSQPQNLYFILFYTQLTVNKSNT